MNGSRMNDLTVDTGTATTAGDGSRYPPQQQQQQQDQQTYYQGYGVAPARIKTTPPRPTEQKMYSEDDEFTPTKVHLIIIAFILAAVASGVGVGIHYASKNLNPQPTKSPTIPSVAPSIEPSFTVPTTVPTIEITTTTGTPTTTVTGSPDGTTTITAQPSSSSSTTTYVCYICGVDVDGTPGIVTQPDTLLTLPTLEESVTCQQLEVAGLSGTVITEEQCRLLVPNVFSDCGCTLPSSSSSPVATTGPTITTAPSIMATAFPTTPPNPNITFAPIFVCPLCGENVTDIGITNRNGTVTLPIDGTTILSCDDLLSLSERGGIDPNTCFDPTFLTTVQTNCVCGYICNICGVGNGFVTNLNGTVTLPVLGERTCSSLVESAQMGELNEQDCDLIQPYIVTEESNPCGCQ